MLHLQDPIYKHLKAKLEKEPATLHFKRVELDPSKNINPGQTTANWTNIFSSVVIPQRVFIVLVRESAFYGDQMLNPFLSLIHI